MKLLQKYHCKIVLICKSNYKLLGIISDGDIRRYLLSGGSLEDESKKAMNTSPITLDFKDRDDSLNVLKNNNIICAPVLNKAKHVVDLLFLDSIRIKNFKPCDNNGRWQRKTIISNYKKNSKTSYQDG